MEESLLTWLDFEYGLLVEGDAKCDLSEKIALVGRTILFILDSSIDESFTVENIATRLNCANAEFDIIKALLKVIASDPENFREYIQGISDNLDETVQRHLMAVFQNKDAVDEESNEDNDELVCYDDESEPQFIVDNIEVAPLTTSGSIVFAEETVQCKACSDLSNRIAQYQGLLDDQKRSEEEKITDLKDKWTAAELESHNKDRRIDELLRRMQDIEAENKKLECQSNKVKDLEMALVNARDEIDRLEPRAAKYDEAEVRIEKYKEKLEYFQDVRQQLDKESKDHTETIEELTKLKKECEELRKLEPQLDAYRNDFSDLKLNFDAVKLALDSREHENAELKKNIQSLVGGQQGNLLQTQLLAEELRESHQKLRENERFGGIGEGMSEFNPVLMQKLSHLEAENENLKKTIQATSVDELNVLKRKQKDADLINSKLNTQLFETKNSLEEALNNIKMLKMELSHSQMNYIVLTCRFSEASQMAEADMDSLHSRSKMNIDNSNAQHSQAMTTTTEKYEAIVAQITSTLQQCESDLADNISMVEQLTAAGQQKDSEIADLTDKLAQSEDNNVQTSTKFMKDLAEQTETFNAKIAEMMEQSEQEKQSMVEAHTEEINIKKRQLDLREVALEEEGVKRRKAERNKKFYETENLRLKSQVQLSVAAGATAGSSEIEVVMKELKVMQSQLDEANAELAILRSSGPVVSGINSVGMVAAPMEAEDQTANVASLSGRPVRAVRMKQGKPDEKDVTRNVVSTSAPSQSNIYSYEAYREQAELNEKKIEQLTREKREMISRNLEENKEKMEVSQKLLITEKEVTALKAENSKLRLEKNRLERSLRKNGEIVENNENIPNQVRA